MLQVRNGFNRALEILPKRNDVDGVASTVVSPCTVCRLVTIPPLPRSRILHLLARLMSHLEATLIAKADHTGLLPKLDVDVGLETQEEACPRKQVSRRERLRLLDPCACFSS